MGPFSRKPVICPIYSTTVALNQRDANGVSDFGAHLDDVDRPGGPWRWPGVARTPSGIPAASPRLAWLTTFRDGAD